MNKRPERQRKVWLDAGLLTVAVALLSVASSIVVSRAYEQVGFEPTLLGVLFVIGTVLAITFTVTQSLERSTFGPLQQLSDSVASIRDLSTPSWLRSREDVMRFEETADFQEIWIVSRRLADELAEPTLHVVRHNLRRGIRYKYIVPDTPASRVRLEQIGAAHQRNLLVSYEFITDAFFDLVPLHDIAIYGPVGTGSDRMVAYMNVPAAEGLQDFMLLDPDYTRELVGKLNQRIEEHRQARTPRQPSDQPTN